MTQPFSDELAAVATLSRIRHHFARADVEAALTYQFDREAAAHATQALFIDQSGGIVIENGGTYGFVGLILAALAQPSKEQQAAVEVFLRDVASDVRVTEEYLEGRRRLAANEGKRF